MKSPSLTVAKNVMRRALVGLVDPVPSDAEQALLRKHFDHRCCYCGADAGPRVGHIDHADPDGGNQLGNLLLACGRCNGDAKREKPWREYLKSVAADASREAKIVEWQTAHPMVLRKMSPEVKAAFDDAERALEAFAESYRRLRKVAR